jgi:hypothetical protein
MPKAQVLLTVFLGQKFLKFSQTQRVFQQVSEAQRPGFDAALNSCFKAAIRPCR